MSRGISDRVLRQLGRLLVFGGAALVAFFLVAMALKPVFPTGLPPGVPFFVIFNGMAVCGLLAGHLACVVAFERSDWGVTGLGAGAWRPVALAVGIVVGLAGILVPAAGLTAAGALRFVPGTPGPWASSLLGAAGILALPALAEELLLRGHAFGELAREWGEAAAIALTSLVFGLLHLGNPGATAWTVAAVVIAGVFLGAVRVATGSLPAAWLAHLAINWAQGGVLHAPISGLEFLPTPGFRAVADGPEWLTGGRWGLEAGAATAATLVVVTFLLVLARPASRKRRRDR